MNFNLKESIISIIISSTKFCSTNAEKVVGNTPTSVKICAFKTPNYVIIHE